MVRRAWFAIVPFTLSCALVSGLDGISVGPPGDGSAMDSPAGDGGANDGVADADAPELPDVLMTSDARAGAAVRMTNMCGTYQVPTDATSFSDKDFSVTFWYEPLANPGSLGRFPIVWRGGRAGGENGWMVGVDSGSLIFCVADPNGGACTTSSWQMPLNHLLHVAALSKVGINQIQRTLAIYVLDRTNSDKNHALVANGTGQNNWNLPLGLAIGGAMSGQCSQTVNGVIDDLRLWSRLLTPNDVDANYATSIACNDLNLVSYYRFDEGIGSVATDCANKLNFDLKGTYAWVPSPFP